jgi:DMSO/TMAO reductase YedYZ molybdopterin-dependent catalytic subunit
VTQKDRLPPGQSLTAAFPTLHYGPVPGFNPAVWDFRIWGEVETPLILTWDQILSLPRRQLTVDLHCVTTWSKLDTVWEGFHLQDLIDAGGLALKPSARFVIQHADYGYTTNLPLKVVLQDNFLFATHYDGKPLTPEHGAPLRGITGTIPGREDLKDVYLWKGAKWLRGLAFSASDQLGFWEANGYHNEADVWKEQRRAG